MVLTIFPCLNAGGAPHRNICLLGDVAAFRAAILDAGLGLAASLDAKYPNADKVSEALYAVTKVVGVYGLEGHWVTLWASSAHSEFLATSEVREVSWCHLCSIRVSRVFFLIVDVVYRILYRR